MYALDLDREETVSEIATGHPVLDPSDKVEKVSKKFLDNSYIDFFPVVKDGVVLGMIWRRSLMDLLARTFGQALLSRKKIIQVMDDSPLIIESNSSLVELSRYVTEKEGASLGDAFIVTQDGKYLGCAHFRDLLRKITDLKVSSAQHANPLSGLPGNRPIQTRIKDLLNKNIEFEVIYVDVDHFKPYNDFYSFEQGDDVIRLMARLLREGISEDQLMKDEGFVGHIGGDDFMIILKRGKKKCQKLCQTLLIRFEKEIAPFYLKEDQESEGISGVDRQGKKQFFPIMSLSLGVLLVKPDVFDHVQRLSSFATKAKKRAKEKSGNSYYVLDTMDMKNLAVKETLVKDVNAYQQRAPNFIAKVTT